jgi:hypothetical protein
MTEVLIPPPDIVALTGACFQLRRSRIRRSQRSGREVSKRTRNAVRAAAIGRWPFFHSPSKRRVSSRGTLFYGRIIGRATMIPTCTSTLTDLFLFPKVGHEIAVVWLGVDGAVGHRRCERLWRGVRGCSFEYGHIASATAAGYASGPQDCPLRPQSDRYGPRAGAERFVVTACEQDVGIRMSA